MEFDINKDAFNPKYYEKFPYGFIQTACERMSKITGYDARKTILEDYKETHSKLSDSYIPTNNILAIFIQCDAISGMRHPATREVMQYSQLAEAYGEVYELSAHQIHGCEYNFSSCVQGVVKLQLGRDMAEKITQNPDERSKWLVNYYKNHNFFSLKSKILLKNDSQG